MSNRLAPESASGPVPERAGMEARALLLADDPPLRAAQAPQAERLVRAAHELKAPASAMLGLAELIITDVDTPVDARHAGYLQHLMSAGRHLMSLIDDMMDLTLAQAGRLSVSPEAFDLQALVTEAVGQATPRARARHIEVTLRCPTQRVRAWADRRRSLQVLNNLLGNAIQYNHEGGRIEVSCGPGPTVSVADSGPGLDDLQVSQLFEPFNRLGRRDAEGSRGAGVGLALSADLMRLMHGTLMVSSTPGVGTVVTMSLPAWPGDRPATVPLAHGLRRSDDRAGAGPSGPLGVPMGSALHGPVHDRVPGPMHTPLAASPTADPEPAPGVTPVAPPFTVPLRTTPGSPAGVAPAAEPLMTGPLHGALHPALQDALRDSLHETLEQALAADRCLLCIDDNPVNAMLLQEFFQLRSGLRVRVAGSAAEGLALARAERPLAVLLDLWLPDMNGLEVLRRLREDALTADIPVAVVSGCINADELRRARELGARACWPKPVDLSRVDSLLAELLVAPTVN